MQDMGRWSYKLSEFVEEVQDRDWIKNCDRYNAEREMRGRQILLCNTHRKRLFQLIRKSENNYVISLFFFVSTYRLHKQ